MWQPARALAAARGPPGTCVGAAKRGWSDTPPYGGTPIAQPRPGSRHLAASGSALPEAARWCHATAVPSSSTISSGIASRVTPSIVVVGATPAAPSRDASTP